MKKMMRFTVFFLMMVCALNSCTKQKPVTLPPIINNTLIIDSSKAPIVIDSNMAPIANAGHDQTIMLPADAFVISGSGTDTDGHIVSYNWNIVAYYSQIGRYAYFNYHTSIAKIPNLSQGTYWCTLTVTDDDGLSASDELVVKVVSEKCPCYPDPCDAFGDPCNPWDY